VRGCIIASVTSPASGTPTDRSWLTRLAGRFLVFDGPDGSGKSTQLDRLSAAAAGAGVRVEHVREPGGTAIGERVRDILLDPIHAEMSLRCEMMLYMASRAQLVEQKIRPALDAGALVVADRYVSSTYAYQGSAGGLPAGEIAAVASAACRDAWPDLVIIYDVDERTAATRLNPLLDRMEQKGLEFHRRVRAGYLDLAAREPERHVVIDASADADVVAAATTATLRERFG
jgi:dTMP kinase